jgi:hypothetical protein
MHWRLIFAPVDGWPDAENLMAWGHPPAAVPTT